MLAACILLLVLGYILIPVFSKVVAIKKSYLVPLTLVFAVAGIYIFRSNPMDLIFLFFFGLVGYAARKFDFDITPLVMGFILTPPLEYAFGQTLILGESGMLHFLIFDRPIALAILVATPIFTFLMWRRSERLRRSLASG
jgi:putative tricarboxylic transport membrane protein